MNRSTLAGVALASSWLALQCAPRTRDTQEPKSEPAPSGATASPSPTPAPDHPPGDSTGSDPDTDALLAELDEPAPGIVAVPGCTELRGRGDCTGVGKVMLGCTALGNILLEEPTRRMVACLTQYQGRTELCDAQVLETCVLPSIDATTTQPLANEACTHIFDACNVAPEDARLFTPRRCAAGLSAAEGTVGRDFVDCMLKRCDLRLCIAGLL